MSSLFCPGCSIGHIQDLAMEISGRATCLSKRGRNAFRTLFLRCGEDVATLAYTLMAPDFSWSSFHQGIGGKTLDELNTFSNGILELVSSHKDAPGLEEWDIYEKKCRLLLYGIAGDEADKLLQMECTLGYFPVATLVLAWLSSRNKRDYHIFRHGFAIWKDAQEKPLATIAVQLGITAERCRQIRNNLLGELVAFLQSIEPEYPCPYNCLDKELEHIVNKVEATDFSANFIRFVFGSLYPSLQVVGDTENCLFVKQKGGKEDVFIAAIPRHLAETYDFNSFLEEIESKNTGKRTEIQYLPLPEWSAEAKRIATSLAELRYGWTADEGRIVMPPNADKNRSDIMEDIIRDAGHPLKIDEIAEEYAKRYPNRATDPTRIRANMQGNPRIVPIGRSGVYSLAEWNTGKARGGTIRSFVRECLDNSDTHIVPAREVYEYVRQFRPSSTDENIITNLMLESEKTFRIIWKDGISYLNYSTGPIPEGYKQITRSFTERRSFQESIALLDKFISLHGRMPRICEDPEQTRLARFLSNLRSLRRRNLLPKEEMEELQRVESIWGSRCKTR